MSLLPNNYPGAAGPLSSMKTPQSKAMALGVFAVAWAIPGFVAYRTIKGRPAPKWTGWLTVATMAIGVGAVVLS